MAAIQNYNSTPQFGAMGQNPNPGALSYDPQMAAMNGMATRPAQGGPVTSGGGGGQAAAFGQPGWQPQFQQNLGGYNPSQYASLDTSNQLAQALGGNVYQTRMGAGSPFNVPNQGSIDFGGDSMLNSGLLAERYAKYDKATADRMTADELKLQGPRSWNVGDEFGSGSMFQAQPGGGQFLGQGQNMGQYVNPNGPRPQQQAPQGPQGPTQPQATPNTPQSMPLGGPFDLMGGGSPVPVRGPSQTASGGDQHQQVLPPQNNLPSNRFRPGGFGTAQNFFQRNNPMTQMFGGQGGQQMQQLLQMLMGGGMGQGSMNGFASFMNQRSPQGQLGGFGGLGMNTPSFGQGLGSFYPKFY